MSRHIGMRERESLVVAWLRLCRVVWSWHHCVWLWSWLCYGGVVALLSCHRCVAGVSCPSVVVMVGCHWGGDVAMAAVVRLVVVGC
jgi:hypothetical protein